MVRIHRAMSLVRLLAPALVLSSACRVESTTTVLGTPGYCGFLFDQHPCVSLKIEPIGEGLRLIRGDTLRLYTYSDSGYGRVRWRIAGMSVAFVNADGSLAGTITTPVDRAVIKGVATGSSIVEVESSVASRTASGTVSVADSSVITTVDAMLTRWATVTSGVFWVERSDTIRVTSTLRDAQGNVYVGRPTWTVSDTSLIRLLPARASCEPTTCSTWIVPRAMGDLELVARFGALADTIRLKVI